MLTPNIRNKESDPKELNIINTALNLFIRVSVDRVSMQQIALAAGVGKTTLYQFFESKNDLLAALLLNDEQELEEFFLQANLTSDPGILLEKYIKFRLQSFDKYKVLYQIEVKLDSEGTPPDRFLLWKNLRGRHIEYMARAIQDVVNIQEADINPLHFYSFVWSFIHGAAQLSESSFFQHLTEDRRSFIQFLSNVCKQFFSK